MMGMVSGYHSINSRVHQDLVLAALLRAQQVKVSSAVTVVAQVAAMAQV